MSIKYALVSKDGVTTDLDDSLLSVLENGSLTFGEDSYSFTSDIISKTGIDGSVSLSDPLLQSRDLVISFSMAYTDYTDYRSKANNILKLMRNTVYVAEREEISSVWTTTRTIKVSPSNASLPYDAGSYQRSGECSLTFTALNPFWKSSTTSQDLNNTVATGSTITIGTITNSGALDAPLVITIEADTACETVQIWNDTTGEGIEIKDPIFGTTSFTIMEIDCEAGTVETSNIDRTAYITFGTGFFTLSTGDNVIKAVVSSECSVNLKWNEKEYL